MSTELSTLRRQRVTVLNGITNSKQQINFLSDKISRLREASSDVQKSITNLNEIKSIIDKLTIDTTRWKGVNESKFMGQYANYQDSVDDFIQKTYGVKHEIDDEISRAEQTKLGYVNGLENLQSTLSSLDSQIRMAERNG